MKAAIVILTSLVTAAALALVASSTALARHAPPYAYPHSTEQATPAQPADLQDARLGPKYVTTPAAEAPAPATPIVRVPSGDGFDWADAALGAGVAAAAIAAAGAGTLLLTRHHPHAHLPSHG